MAPIGHMDWIGLDVESWTHVQLWLQDQDVYSLHQSSDVQQSKHISAQFTKSCRSLCILYCTKR